MSSSHSPIPAGVLSATAEVPRLTLRERNKLRVKEDLVDAVINELARSETGLCVLDDVLRRAGLSKGTFYNHFPGGRDQLLLLAYEQLGREFRALSERLRNERERSQQKVMAFADAYFSICEMPLNGKLYSVSEPALLPILAPAIGQTSGWVKEAIKGDLMSTSNFQGSGGQVRAEACATLIVGAIREAGRKVHATPILRPALSEELLGIIEGIM